VDIAQKKEIRSSKFLSHAVAALAFSNDGELLAAAGAESVKLIDVKTGTCRTTAQGHTGTVRTVAFSPDGKMMASGDWEPRVKIWDARSFHELISLTGGGNRVAFSPDDQKLVSIDYLQGLVHLWNLANASQFATRHWQLKSLNFAAFGHDGIPLAAVPDKNGAEQLINLSTGKPAKAKELVKAVKDTREILSPDGLVKAKIVKTGIIDDIELSDAKTKKLVSILRGHNLPIYTLAFSPDGKSLASTSKDRTVRLWNVATGDERAVLSLGHFAMHALVFSQDGKKLLGVGTLGGDPEHRFEIVAWDGTPRP
jgi:WD40 repeat protein